MSNEPLTLIPAPDHERVNLNIPKIAAQLSDTPRGQVLADEVPGMLTIDIKRPEGETTVGVVLYRLLPAIGMMVQMDAATARRTGLSLISLADEIDAAKAAKEAEAANVPAE